MFSLVTRWRRRTKLDVEHVQFTVYTRADCGCCHKAFELLKRYQRQHRFAIDEVDIDADAELKARYDTTVPVVAMNGKVRFRGIVNPVLLERLLLAESRGR